MKKIAVLMIMVMAVSQIMAQSPKVQSAYNYLKSGKLDKAKENIDEAAKNPKTMNNPKTWFYLGNIYLSIYTSTNPDYKKLSDNALDIAYDAFKKTKELDTKNEFENQLKLDLINVADQYFNKGVSLIKSNKDYLGAEKDFLESKDINESFGGLDSLSTYYAAIGAEYGGDTANAIRLYNQLVDANYDQPNTYVSLTTIYRAKDEMDKALATIKLAREKYPDNTDVIITETNLYLKMGDSQKALEDLKLALAKEKTNPTLYFAAGVQYNIIADDTTKSDTIRKEAFSEAEKAYKNAVALDSNYFDPNYNLGALYVNKAAAIIGIANQLPFGDKRYDAMKVEADSYLKEAIPYLERAVALHPDDINSLSSLREIYARLGQYEKANAIKERIDKLTK